MTSYIRRLRTNYQRIFKLRDQSNLNEGLCEDFAQDIERAFPEAKAIWVDSGRSNESVQRNPWPQHMIIRYRGRYFDAECPLGVKNRRKLPICERFRQAGF